jgi:hypothetical protein
VLSPSWEAANRSSTQEYPNSSGNPRIHCRVHKNPLLVPILSQINPVHTTPSCLSKIRFNNVTVISEPAPYRPLMSHVPDLSLSCLSKEAVQVHFVRTTPCPLSATVYLLLFVLTWRPCPLWHAMVLLDLEGTGRRIVEWIHVAQDRDRCSASVNTIMNFWVP